MDTPTLSENQMLAEIERLRGQFPNTQELYREVCVLLFFRYGITPTANKLYQYVKKGSMSAPAEALAKFWETLREKSRVRIEHPDLPEEIKAGAGELAAALWMQAQDKAAAALRSREDEARASVMEAQAAQAAAEAQRDALRAERDKAQADLAQAREQIDALQQRLAAESAARAMLDAQLAQAQADIAAQRQANERARQDFTAEIEKLRGEARLAEERFRAAEKRAMLEIDRERSASSRLQKELEATRSDAARAGEQHRLETQALQQQLGDLRQRAGMLEGQLQAAKGAGEDLARDLREAQRQITGAAVRAAALEAERDDWRNRADAAEKAVREWKERPPRARQTKKAGFSS